MEETTIRFYTTLKRGRSFCMISGYVTIPTSFLDSLYESSREYPFLGRMREIERIRQKIEKEYIPQVLGEKSPYEALRRILEKEGFPLSGMGIQIIEVEKIQRNSNPS